MITQLVGGFHIKALCEDGQERICRIPGKMKKRIWMRLNDIVILKLWDFQPIKADIVWRFTEVQAHHLKNKGYLQKLPY
ncbi:MAG TPA: translation initiation factor eIF-1A [Candidatus Diapherotrites archaeon]|uniref:Translation initiation factor 1A n=1 Tax=Candidatus Iainarchaeum sp. TaxID=3101447 RepID=A0A7J4JP18_9ARCH|nr:translation initiation factor eIF-1A [Candidatus Diapherotrites archaeon]